MTRVFGRHALVASDELGYSEFDIRVEFGARLTDLKPDPRGDGPQTDGRKAVRERVPRTS